MAVRAADSLRTSTKREPHTGKDRARQEAIIIPGSSPLSGRLLPARKGLGLIYETMKDCVY